MLALALAACGNAATAACRAGSRATSCSSGRTRRAASRRSACARAIRWRRARRCLRSMPTCSRSDVNTDDRAGRRSARAARAARSRAAAQGGGRRAGGAGEARRGDAAALHRRARTPAAAHRAGVGTQAALDTAKANFNRDKAALDEVRRQITVAQLSARDEDIAAARQALAAAEARRTAPRPSSRGASSSRRSAARCSRSITARANWCRPAGRCCRSCRPATSRCASSSAKRCCRRSRSATPCRSTCDGCREPSAKVSFIARAAEYTPPVIYSLEERNKLVFMVEARPRSRTACASASR